MGALNGKTFNNSFVFNKAFQWRGLLVELLPDKYQDLVQNRPNELAIVNAAVCDKHQTVHYYHNARLPHVSGAWEFAADSFRQQWWKSVTIRQTTPIECSPLWDLLQKHVPDQHFFDFFSVDIEGGVCGTAIA